MNTTLQGKRVALLVEDGFEQEELLRPRERLRKWSVNGIDIFLLMDWRRASRPFFSPCKSPAPRKTRSLRCGKRPDPTEGVRLHCCHRRDLGGTLRLGETGC
jgi:hypothetical protein